MLDPGHEPRGSPEFESMHSVWDRPRRGNFSGENAVVDGRSAQIAAISDGAGKRGARRWSYACPEVTRETSEDRELPAAFERTGR